MRALRLSTRGRLQESEWRAYAARAMTLTKQIGDVTAVELGRMMMEQLPAHPWRRKLLEETEKRNNCTGDKRLSTGNHSR